MQKTKNIFLKFIVITAAFNFPIGIWMILESVLNKTGEALITNAVSGEFILFAGAALIWATKDIATRAPIIVWNGLVRFFSVFLVLYASTNGEVPKEMLIITIMDLIVSIIYVVGSVKVTRISFLKLLIGKTSL